MFVFIISIVSSHNQAITIQRSTLLLGQTTPDVTNLVTVNVTDENINNPAGGTNYTRLANLTWVATPPAGITTYIFRITAAASNHISIVTYTNRALNAIVFPIDSSLN